MDSQKQLISVLIPSYNSEDYIRQCVESVCNQTFSDLEIICIDGGSCDKTVDILKLLADNDSRIKIVNSDKKSYGHQMNLGLRSANGKYISIVESDDFIDENMLKTLYELGEEYDADIVKTTFYHYHDFTNKVGINDSKNSIDVEGTFTLLEYPVFISGHPSIWSAIYNKNFLNKNNISFVEEKGAGWVDNPFFFETSFLAEKIVYRNTPYYYYRETNPNSSSNTLEDYKIPMKRMLENLDIVDRFNPDNEILLKYIYIRAFTYINSIRKRKGHEEHMGEVRPLIQQMVLRLDEEIVLKYLGQKYIAEYYKYISPLYLLKNDDSLSQRDLELMRKENEYLYSKIDKYEKDASQSQKRIKSLQNEIKLIKTSKAYKLGEILAMPIRKIRSMLK